MLKSILLSEECHNDINKLTDTYKITKKDLVEKSIRYIVKNNINPEEIKSGEVAGQLKKLRNDFVAFIKKQESDLLQPTLEAIRMCVEQNDKTSKILPVIYKKQTDNENTIKELSENLKKYYQQQQEIVKKMNDFNEKLTLINTTIAQKLGKSLF
ncbi:MAG: BfmA/BtgA family mobilization protein [Cytophagaceae bacterium]